VIDEVRDAVQLDLAMRILGQDLGIGRVMSLTRKHRGDARPPDLLHGIQDTQLVVDHHVVFRGIQPLDVVQFLLLVDIDQHVPVEGPPQPRALHLARLKHRVAV
jgi:hypothetical protein